VSEIADFESRITMALERINAGLDAMAASGADDVAALNEALDVEKMANSQLQEQVDALGEKLAGQEDQLRDLEQHTKRLNDENAELRLSSEKIAADAADADAANVAIRTELEALRVTRKTDLAELQTIMDELKPIIAGGV
jgi:regulator of replication initiation timing